MEEGLRCKEMQVPFLERGAWTIGRGGELAERVTVSRKEDTVCILGDGGRHETQRERERGTWEEERGREKREGV